MSPTIMDGDSDSYSTMYLHQMLAGSGRIDPITDQMIGIDDDQHMLPQHKDPNADPAARSDSFHYRDPRTGKLMPVR